LKHSYKAQVMADSDSDKTRDRILEAAGELFAERGFESTTVRDICHAAGANVAAVNYYFGDKERLYVEAVVRAHKWRLDQAQLPDWDDGTPPREKLADFVATFFRRVLGGPEDTWRTRLVMREIMQPSAACAEIAQSNIRPQFEILQAILRELLPAGTSDEQLHLTAFSIVGQCLFFHVADPITRCLVDQREYSTYDIDKLAKHVTQFTLAAIDAKVTAGVAPLSRREGAQR
jgi:TetR/AcrR family transcriptional regulator, regulator of cefoperazone and chloramphenicol sensitivity